MKVITIINQKGGVAKTTTSQNLSYALVKKGYKVLAIDLDSQQNLSYITKASNNYKSIFEVLSNDADINETIQTIDNLDFIRASEKLSIIDTVLFKTGKEYKLKEKIAKIKNKYDYIIIDTAPALNILTINALVASNEIVITALADILSLQGITNLIETIEPIKQYCNNSLQIKGILLTKYNERLSLNKELLQSFESVAKANNTKIFKTKIRESIAVRESQANRQPIIYYAKNNNASIDYDNFTKEFLKD